ncbi:hypothetical protein BSU01_02130, partial [Erwinia billingiae]|uniref:hypothetical protein n=1 Tax=Erwinia billingiae TaxID=182337 RepID=UPI0019D16A69
MKTPLKLIALIVAAAAFNASATDSLVEQGLNMAALVSATYPNEAKQLVNIVADYQHGLVSADTLRNSIDVVGADAPKNESSPMSTLTPATAAPLQVMGPNNIKINQQQIALADAQI